MSYIYDVLLRHLREELDAGPGIDITNGVISATGVEAVGGVGISTAGGTISLAPASVSDVISGSGSAAVVPSNLASALSVGKAVDVTSMPDGFIGSDWRAPFTWTGATLGFASFPKFASGLSYILIADLTAEEAATVTPSGSWLSGGSAALSLPAGSTVRVAMTFSTASSCLLTFSSGATVSVANLREFEVTALSAEAIAYVAALASPDAVNAYYLVDQDNVNPWTPYIDMGTSPAVTIQAGLAYKLNAQSGSHTLTVDTFSANSFGRDAHLELFVGATGLVTFAPPLNLIDALTPNAVHNITVRFRDGQANAYIDDTDVGYVVTLTAGTVSGSLYAALQSGSDYVVFANSIDGETVDLSGVVTAGKKTVVGNGYTSTMLTGSVSCTSQTTFTNLTLSDVQVMGGTMTLGDAFIPSGSTVSVDSSIPATAAPLRAERVTGDGTIDVNGDHPVDAAGFIGGVQITGYNGNHQTGYGAVRVVSAGVTISDCTFSSNTGDTFGCCIANNGDSTECSVISCTFRDNSSNQVYGYKTKYTFSSCVFEDTTVNIRLYTTSASARFTGSNMLAGRVVDSGSVIITSGAVIDLTGNTNATPIAPGGGVNVDGGCTVINSAGSTVSIAGGTYTKINKDGTTVPPQEG